MTTATLVVGCRNGIKPTADGNDGDLVQLLAADGGDDANLGG